MCSSNGGAGTAETDRCDAAGTSAEEAPGADALDAGRESGEGFAGASDKEVLMLAELSVTTGEVAPGISSALASTLSLGESASPDNPDGISDLPSSSGTLDAWWPAGTVLRARISSTKLSTSCARTPAGSAEDCGDAFAEAPVERDEERGGATGTGQLSSAFCVAEAALAEVPPGTEGASSSSCETAFPPLSA